MTAGRAQRASRRSVPGVAVLLSVVVALGLAGAGLFALSTTGPGRVGHRPVEALAGGARLLAGGRTGAQAAGGTQFQTWLHEGKVPAGDYAALATTALADLHSLTLQNGGVVASVRHSWRYVWPRDTAFAAVALARTGHLPDALRALGFLQAVQGRDGSFQARYRVDGSGPPDARGVQDDDPGWALWSVDEVVAAAPADRREQIATSLRPLVDRSLQRLLDRTAGPGALPAPSSDYWELGESRLTLGVAAPTLVGLLSGSRLVRGHSPAEADLAARRATTLRASIQSRFGSSGYSRYAGGSGPDAALAFTLPPYVDSPLPGAVEAARAAVPRLREPGGGLSPGSTWPRHDGVSWTPETALFLVAAAEIGDTQQAEHWLAWFATRAASGGALPEKVRADGSAGDVAPLAWTDALVLIAMDRLDLLGPSA